MRFEQWTFEGEVEGWCRSASGGRFRCEKWKWLLVEFQRIWSASPTSGEEFECMATEVAVMELDGFSSCGNFVAGSWDRSLDITWCCVFNSVEYSASVSLSFCSCSRASSRSLRVAVKSFCASSRSLQVAVKRFWRCSSLASCICLCDSALAFVRSSSRDSDNKKCFSSLIPSPWLCCCC